MTHRLLKCWKIRTNIRNFRLGGCYLKSSIRNSGYFKVPAAFLSSQRILVPKVCVCRTLRNVSSDSGSSDSSDSDSDLDDELEKEFKDDPELKKLVQEFTTHFKQERTSKEETSEFADNTNKIENNEEGPEEIEEYVEMDSQDSIEDKKQEYYRQQEKILEAEIQRKYTMDEEEFVFDTVEKPTAISLERGETGVFDISEVVVLLRADNAMDICVIETPPLLNYVDHIVVVTGKSFRHLKGMAETIKRLYKKKREEGDSASVQIEGLTSRNWLALDLGNIAVHLFLEETREVYDLETLWSVGSQFDDLSQQVSDDPLVALLSDDYLKQLQIMSDIESHDASKVNS